MHAVNLRLLCLHERRHLLSTRVSYVQMKGDTCCVRASHMSWPKEMRVVNRISSASMKEDTWCESASPLSRLKEMRLVDTCLLCLEERRRVLWARVRMSYDPPMSWFHMHLIKLGLTSQFTNIHIIHMHHMIKFSIISSQVKKHH
jgi:hypothetical protein